MGYCKFCEQEPIENWFGSYCVGCRKIKNLGNVYGFKRTLSILTKCCIRDESQLERKIESHKQKKLDTIVEEDSDKTPLLDDKTYEKPKTRNGKKVKFAATQAE